MVLIHLTCSLLSYAAFLIAFVAGVLFLVQERQVKRKQLGLLFHRLPSLNTLDRANFLAVGIGFTLLSMGLACGVFGAKVWYGRWWSWDPKECLTAVLWSAYLVLWMVRLRSTLRGRRVALLSILGFALALFTFLGVTRLLPSWHVYV